jgi:predicted permease
MIRRFLAGLRDLFRGGAIDRDLDDELRDFEARAVEEQERRGVPPDAALRRARVWIGSRTAVKDEIRDGLWESAISAAARDVRHAARMLRRNPGFTAVAVLTLALGLGATTALVSVADKVLFKPLPVASPDELVVFRWSAPPNGVPRVSIAGMYQDGATGRSWSTAFSRLAYQRFSADTSSFAGVLAFAAAMSAPSAPGLTDGDRGHIVSGNYFALLGVRPAHGRLITPDDDRPGAPLVAVITDGYWRRRFGRDPAAIGQTLRIGAFVPALGLHPAAAAIVGIAPPGFTGVGDVGDAPDFFLPLLAAAPVAGNKFAARMSQTWVWPLRLLGRLQRGADLDDVALQLQQPFQQTALEAWRAQNGAAPMAALPTVELEPGSRGFSDGRRSLAAPLAIVAAIIGVVLLVAGVNVAGLLLARAETRREEIAVRLAIGAGRGRLLRQLVTEGLVLAACAAVAGVLLAFWGREVFVALLARADAGFAVEPGFDTRVLAVTATVTLAVGALIGLASGIRAVRLGSTRPPRGLGAPASSTSGRVLLVVQVALSLILVVGAGLFVRTLMNLQAADVGFGAGNVLLFRSAFPPGPADPAAEARAAVAYARFVDRLDALPGVDGATYSQHSLVGGDLAMPYLTVPGQPRQDGEDRTVYTQAVAPAFFDVMQMPMVAGRAFVAGDARRPVAVVNETLARRYFAGQAPIGRRIGITKDVEAPELADAALFEIVGVVRDAKYMTLRDRPMPTVFVPYRSIGAATYAVRASIDPSTLIPAIRDVAQQMGGGLVVSEFRTQADQIALTLARERDLAWISTAFGGLAVGLTSIGLYGLLSCRVARRTREIGIRTALGAARGNVIAAMLAESLRLVGAGVLIGAALSLLVARLLQNQLFGLAPTDVVSTGVGIAVMLLVALLAALLPARRASRVDPVLTLRAE